MNNKKNKGFTLIELLGVIVVLAALALIVMPIISNVLKSAGKSTFRQSVNNIIDSADIYINTRRTIKYAGPIDYPVIFECNGYNCQNEGGESLDFERSVPVSGKIIIASDGIVASMITNGTYCAYGKKLNLEISTKCNVLDHSNPIIDDSKDITLTSSTNSIIVSIPNGLMTDDETGIQEYKVQLYKGSSKISEKTYNGTSVSFTNLTSDTEYKVIVVGINGNNGTSSIERTVWTHKLINPILAYENTPTNPINDYLKSQTIKVTYNNSNVVEAKYFIKSTRDALLSANTIESCGNGSDPGTCTVTSTKNISANIWYKVSGNIDVIYNQTATTTATIYAVLYDGTNYSGAATKTVSKIDATKPTVTLGTAASKTNSITIGYTLSDSHSGIGSYTCKYSDTAGNYAYNGSATQTGCTLPALANNTTYYYQICVTDGVGNAGDCKTDSYGTADFTNPVIAYANTPSTPVNDYLKQQVAKVTFSNSNVTSAQYFIKTTRAGTASADITASCGTGDNPETCTSATTKSLAANTWYRVSGNINVTYNQTATSTATIYAVTYDGNNFSGATTKTIAKIDAEKPTVTFGIITPRTNSITINYTLADSYSGVGSYTCKYSDTANTYTTNGNTVTDTSCTITGLKDNKTYYYQICVTDGVGNAGDCKTDSYGTADFTNPVIAYANTPSTPVNDYLKQQVAKVTFSNSNVTSAQYFIKTTRAGTASANTVASCGTGTNPGTCTTAATKSLVADTWYKVSGNINVTYNQTATSTATIYAVTYDGNNFSTAASKTISKIDAEKPTVTLGTVTAKTNSLTIAYTLADAKTGISSYTCKYSDTSGSYTTNGNTITDTSCTITGLKDNKTYYYQVCTTDGVGNAGDCKTGNTGTSAFTIPTITYANTPGTAVSDYFKQQVAKVVFSNANVTSAQYFIKTTRAGTASANTVASCGTGTNPGTCTTAATKSLVADTWYKVSGNINVTYNQTATSTATIYAVTYDGNNFSTAASKTISKIDAEKPTVTLGTITSKTNSLVINYTLADAKTGIGSYTCKYSATSGSYTTNGNTVTDTSCTITGLANNTTYYYQVCVTDGVGNAGDCKTGSTATSQFTAPTITYANTPGTAVSDYFKQQVAKVVFSNTNVTSPQYFIKTTRAGTASAKTTQACGTGDKPASCSNSAVTALAANTWYKVSGNINVTYSATATSTATIYAITYDGNNFSGATSKTISKIDAEKPTVTLGTVTSKTNGLTITYTLTDAKTGIGSYTCKYSATSGSYTTNANSVTDTSCSITGLANNKTYYYQVCATDGVGNTGDCKTGDTATANFTNPTIAYANTPGTAVSDYFKQQVAKVTFSNTNITSPQYFIKTTRAGTASAKTTQACGTGDKPGTCTASAVTALTADTWYKVSGNINVTYSATATSTATIYAITYDGTNFSGATSKTISKIDAEKPTVTLGTATSKTNSFEVPYTLEDAKTGIGSYTCKYSATSGSYTTNGNSVTATKCSATGLTANTTYYYQVCTTDGVGNAGDCKTGSIKTKAITDSTITYANTPGTAVSDYFKQQVAKVVFSNANITSPQYFIKTTRAGTASAKTTHSCGTGDKPGTCTASAVTALAANTWYKVSGNINVTYSATATSTATIYAITYDGNNYGSSVSKTISKIDAEKPTVTLGTATSKTNSFEVPYTLEDAKTGIGSYTCKYSATSGSYTTNGNSVTATKCSATGLTANTTYYYQVCTTDGVGNAGDCKTGSIKTKAITDSTITYANTPGTAVSDYFKQQVAKVVFSNANITSPQYFIKTTRAGTASAKTTHSCGTGDKPGTCTASAVTALAANTWYKVSGNINVTYSATATSTATIYAITYDGNNYGSSVSKTISKIDAEKPTVTLGTESTKTNSFTVAYTTADAKTGIGTTTCKYSATSGSYTTNGSSVTNSSCTATGLTAGTKYYYQVCTTDGVGNAGDCKTGDVTLPVMSQPTCTYANTPGTAVSDYYKSQVLKCSFDKTNISNPQLYVKTTRAGTSSVKTTHSCGTGTSPGACTASAVTALAANTWYKISGNSANFTYNATATGTATLTLIANDGNNSGGSTSKTISKIDAEKPTVTLGTVTTKTNSITVAYTTTDAKTGIGSTTCKYSATSGSYTTNGNSVTNSSCTMTGLTANTTYYYQVCTTDGVGNAGDCKTGNAKTPAVPQPTCTYANTPGTAVSDYYKSQVLKCSFDKTNVSNPQLYVKTTRAGTSSVKTTHSCGTGTSPGACTASAVTALAANTWYKISGNSANFTYNATATGTATLTLIANDGNNSGGTASKTISKIDAEKPTVTLGTVATKTNSITVAYTTADAKTGIGSTTCKYSATSGSYTTNGSSVTNSSCTMTGLTAGTKYYYQVCTTDGVGNVGDCKAGNATPPAVPQPTCTYANTPGTAVNGYLQKQVVKCTFSNTNVTSPQYFIKTTRVGTASANTTQACGTGDKPASCSNSAVTALAANTWYKVSGNINVTYSANATAEATLTALTYDGKTYSASTAKTVSKIDVEKPSLSVSVSGKVATLTKSDAKSGLASYCVVSTNSSSGCSWTSNTAASVTWTASSAGTYYAFVKDGVGNISDSKSFTIATTAFCTFTSKDFTYTGNIQSWKVPDGCGGTYLLEVWGAQGSNWTYWTCLSGKCIGGKGGYAKGTVSLTAGTTIYIGVGGQAGYNGGGLSNGEGANGGGATHIGKSNATLANTASSNVYIVAGGGGGAGHNNATGDSYENTANGGAGGGTSGSNGTSSDTRASNYGKGASQTAGGSSGGAYGVGGSGTGESYQNGGGGGGGYYGGGASIGNYNGTGGGGGGSSYTGGVSNGSTTAGQQSGNGKAKITKQ